MDPIDEKNLPRELLELLRHGREETYLEYKGDVPWSDRKKMLEILQTIFALSNEQGGGTIIIGVKDNGERIGLSEGNFSTYSHDKINQKLKGKANQNIHCKVTKHRVRMEDKDTEKNFVFIEIAESKEFPLVYISGLEKFNPSVRSYGKNIALRASALYIRNQNENGNKEIETTKEWQNLIERTFAKYERETLRRYFTIRGEKRNPFDEELKI